MVVGAGNAYVAEAKRQLFGTVGIDLLAGPTDVLPTGRAGRYTGGLWVGKFLKTVTYQRVTPTGSALVAPPTAAIADAELMFGHALTARLRLDPTGVS